MMVNLPGTDVMVLYDPGVEKRVPFIPGGRFWLDDPTYPELQCITCHGSTIAVGVVYFHSILGSARVGLAIDCQTCRMFRDKNMRN